MRITDSGNVGIGTTSPNAKLVVKGGGLVSQDFFHIEDSGGIRMLEVTSDGAGNSNLQVKDTAGATKSLINSAGNSYFNGGNVGIGTTSPSSEANLSLAANSTSEGGHLVLFKGTSQTQATHLDNYSNTFRIMNGADASSGAVQFSLNHTTAAATFTGLVSGITPVNAANFVTKAYVDGSGGGTGPFLPLAGGTLTGDLTVDGCWYYNRH